jgi:hypothetical protein
MPRLRHEAQARMLGNGLCTALPRRSLAQKQRTSTARISSRTQPTKSRWSCTSGRSQVSGDQLTSDRLEKALPHLRGTIRRLCGEAPVVASRWIVGREADHVCAHRRVLDSWIVLREPRDHVGRGEPFGHRRSGVHHAVGDRAVIQHGVSVQAGLSVSRGTVEAASGWPGADGGGSYSVGGGSVARWKRSTRGRSLSTVTSGNWQNRAAVKDPL